MTKQEAAAWLEQIERALAGEFRLYQKLLDVTRRERKALTGGGLLPLSDVIAEKERLIDELHELELAREDAVRAYASSGGDLPADTLSDVIAAVDAATADRFNRLRDGILSIASQLRELGNGNRALAGVALDRLEATRNYLISLTAPVPAYGPSLNAVTPVVSLAVELSA
jgi:hypothetical protein